MIKRVPTLLIRLVWPVDERPVDERPVGSVQTSGRSKPQVTWL